MNKDSLRDTSTAVSVKVTSDQIRCQDVSADSSEERYHDPCDTGEKERKRGDEKGGGTRETGR